MQGLGKSNYPAEVFRHLLDERPRLLVLSQGWGLSDLPLRATFSPAHPLADIFYPPDPPIAPQSITRDVP